MQFIWKAYRSAGESLRATAILAFSSGCKCLADLVAKAGNTSFSQT